MKTLASAFVFTALIVSPGCKTQQQDESQAKAVSLKFEDVLAGEGQGWCPNKDESGDGPNIYTPANRGPAVKIGTLAADGEKVAGTKNAFRTPSFRFAGGKLSALNEDRAVYSQMYFAENGIRSTLADHNAMEFRIAYSELDCKTRAACTAKLNNNSNQDIVTQSSTPEPVNVRRVDNKGSGKLNNLIYFKLEDNVTIQGLMAIASDHKTLEDGIHFKMIAPIYVKVLDLNNRPLFFNDNPNQTFVGCMN